MRKQYDSVAALAQTIGHELERSAIFRSVGKTPLRAKTLYFDGTATELTLIFAGSELVFRRALTPPWCLAKPRESLLSRASAPSSPRGSDRSPSRSSVGCRGERFVFGSSATHQSMRQSQYQRERAA